MGCSHHCLTETHLILAFRTNLSYSDSMYTAVREKEHLFWIQELISGPTKVHSTAITPRTQLWVAKSYLPHQGVNSTSTSGSNISTQRAKLRAALAGGSLWLGQLPFLSCSRNLARRPHGCWTQQPKQLPRQDLLFVLLLSLHPAPLKASPDKSLLRSLLLWGWQVSVYAKKPSPLYVQKPKSWNESVLLPEIWEINHNL